MSAIEPIGVGHVITNPPYGQRVGDGDMRNLYARLGSVLRAKCPGWQAAMLSSDVQLEHSTGLKFEPILRFSNGGIKVRFVQAKVGQVADLPGR